MIRDSYYIRFGVLMLIIVLSFIFSIKSYSQIIVTEFNACWNRENKTEWLDSLQNCYLTKVEIDRIGKRQLQEKHNIEIVPTLIIFKDGKEVKRYVADISFCLTTRREEVQLVIDKLNKIK